MSKFPPDVLGNIFRWNVTLEEPFDGIKEESYNFLLVCHHWFEVASRAPELWAFWGNNLEDWEKRCLRSSVGTPLDLVLDGPLTHMFNFLGEFNGWRSRTVPSAIPYGGFTFKVIYTIF